MASGPDVAVVTIPSKEVVAFGQCDYSFCYEYITGKHSILAEEWDHYLLLYIVKRNETFETMLVDIFKFHESWSQTSEYLT